jgi:hypothetical protein
MPRVVAMAVMHGDPPEVIIADDEPTLSWRIALQLVASTDPSTIPAQELEQLRHELVHEYWGAAVERWVRITDVVIDIYSAWDLHTVDDLDIAPAELQFSRLFQDGSDR